jgi:succinate dehydrogenase / fumarate reductase membrane anchor subunit
MAIPEKTIANPTTRYGTAKASSWRFIVQRVTAGLNVAFTLFLIWLVVRLAGADASTMGSLLANPIIALVTGLMILSTAVHMQIGMREVIEDYVHDDKLNRLCLLLNTLVSVVIALATLAALAKLVFWG